MDDLDGDSPLEMAVVREIDRRHAAVAQLFKNLVFGFREIGPISNIAKMGQSGIREPGHSASTPKSRRASLENSSALPVVRRSRSNTLRLNSDRAKARKLVT